MIIQCDHCSAKFRIDDAKLANGAVKVRCAKCKEVFVVEREESAAESVQAPQAVVVPSAPPAPGDFPSDSFGESSDFSFEQEQASGSGPAETQSPAADEFDWKDTSVNLDTPGSPAEFDSAPFQADATSVTIAQGEATPATAENDFDFGDINMQASPTAGNPPAESPSQDEFSIDFGEVSFAAPNQPSSVTAGPSHGGPTDDFSFDATPAADSSSAAGQDDFLLSFDAEEAKPVAVPSEGAENVNFGDFSFGEMADETIAIKPVAKERLPTPEKDFVSAPLAEAADEELVPTSLASRKKSSSRFPLFLIFGAIVIIVALAGSGVFFFGGAKAFSKVGLGFLVDWYGEKSAEEGSMSIRNISSSYVVNSSAGELFVVRGEAVNNFKKPRASVQVKVSILGVGGTVLVSKSAFCGNSLSPEQLTSLPLAKIEETMNNQFGDSLANLGVKPGSAIPFVVVLSGVSKEATDFSAQIAGSTVASQ